MCIGARHQKLICTPVIIYIKKKLISMYYINKNGIKIQIIVLFIFPSVASGFQGGRFAPGM